jgi:hypothetical protein
MLFTLSKHYKSNYLVDPDKFGVEIDGKQNIAIPLVVDSEFVAPDTKDFIKNEFAYRKGVTVQCKHAIYNDGIMFVHSDFANCEKRALEFPIEQFPFRHSVTKHDFIIGDYLESRGRDVKMWRDDSDTKRPMLLVVLYAHFALADLNILFPNGGEFFADIAHAYKCGKIGMKRRLNCEGGQAHFKWIISIDGFEYRISLKIVDTAGANGIAKYSEFCANSGVVLDDKHKIDSEWIVQMDRAYFLKSQAFDDYAMGDLKVYDALLGFADNMRVVWDDLDISDYFKIPDPTIGSTVVKLFESKVLKTFDVSADHVFKKSPAKDIDEKKDFLNAITGQATAEFFKSMPRSHASLLGKCFGGRCKSNNPLVTKVKIDGIDIDISGAYSSAMSILDFPFGVPTVYASRYNGAGVNLRDVLRVFGRELLPRTWTMIFNAHDLNYDMDIFPSWFDQSRKLLLSNAELKIESGESKVFMREVEKGVLTSDLLDLVDQLSPRQRDDFYNKCEVVAIAFYPKSFKMSVCDFKKRSGVKTFRSKSKIISILEPVTHSDHRWCAVKLGSFFTDTMRAKRAQYDKKIESQKPLNSLYKLLGNATYGTSVSRFFETSNMIVGNNITGMVRAFGWMCEKALNTFGWITDGQIFDRNNVVFRNNGRLNTEYLARLYNVPRWCFKDNDAGCFGRLEYTLIDNPTNDPSITAKNMCIVNDAALRHVSTVFYKSPLLHDTFDFLDTTLCDGVVRYIKQRGAFTFEMKDFMTDVVFHGSSNYSSDPTKSEKTKMRSSELSKQHSAFTLVDGVLTDTDCYETLKPAQIMLCEIANNPHAVKRLPPHCKTAILKPTEFRAFYYNANTGKNKTSFDDDWNGSPLLPGDNILKAGRPIYYSLSQYTYIDKSQYLSWKKAAQKLKLRYGESFEIFFTNKDETVDYAKMIVTIDKMIREGVRDPLKVFDKHNNLCKLITKTSSTYHQACKDLKHAIKNAYFVENYDEYESDFDPND